MYRLNRINEQNLALVDKLLRRNEQNLAAVHGLMQYTQNSSLNVDLSAVIAGSSAQQSIANINALPERRTKILPVPLPPTAFLKDRPIDNNSIFIRPSRPRVRGINESFLKTSK